ncbi:PQQ-binding-like beta-propeller repeat protein [Marispirochaeta sp.]|uniref:PQQ-binding-like beta-propeller repeat protein n=1 Tax=Marispirochaeta sp. TaxID=2038653 RepID=UPI0029C6ACA1|nr:PQQ-binding-like beta-propeller repeat protein [Marispirochaeta sp.]
MRRPRFLIILAFVLLTLSCADKAHWVMFRGTKSRGYTPERVYPPLAVKWKLKLQDSPGEKRSFNPPVVVDDTIYFGSNDGNFYALDVESGYMRWVFKTLSPINSLPYADEQKVYFGSSDGYLYAVDRENGEKVWDFNTRSPVNSTVIGYEDGIVFTSDAGASYFFSADGELQHQIPNPVWLSHSFQIQDHVMYFAPGPETSPHSFGAYDIRARDYLWFIDTWDNAPTWYSFPAKKGSILHYATSRLYVDGWLLTYYGLNAVNGEIEWVREEPAVLPVWPDIDHYTLFEDSLELLDYLAPALWKDLVIYSSGDNVIRAFKGKTGKTAWRREFLQPASSSPIVAGDRVYIGLRGSLDEDTMEKQYPSLLVCLSARSGKVLWEYETDGDILSAPVIAGGWIIFGTDNSFFYVLEEVF